MSCAMVFPMRFHNLNKFTFCSSCALSLLFRRSLLIHEVRPRTSVNVRRYLINCYTRRKSRRKSVLNFAIFVWNRVRAQKEKRKNTESSQMLQTETILLEASRAHTKKRKHLSSLLQISDTLRFPINFGIFRNAFDDNFRDFLGI